MVVESTNRLNNLIQKLCPDGVKYVSLGEVVSFTDGFSFSSGDFSENGTFQVVKITDIFEGKVNVGKTFIDTLPNKLKSGQLLAGGEIVVAMSGSTGKTGYNKLENAVVNQRIAILRNTSEIDNGFLKHLIVNKSFEEYCFKNGTGPQNNISKSLILKYRIPLPPLPVQQEIVRILDSFTELTAELTAELAARRKQYEHYRDELLRIGVPIKLSDIAYYSRGRIAASTLTESTYVGVDNLLPNKLGKRNSECVPTDGNVTEFKQGDILVGNIRPYLKKIWKATTNGGTNGDVLPIRVIDNNVVSANYLYYVLSSDHFFTYDSNNAKGAKMPRGDKEAIMNYQFQLPSILEQQRIVTVLDRFDTLCNDLTSGLPAEIAARQKQYEYYRDKLLTFKELEG